VPTREGGAEAGRNCEGYDPAKAGSQDGRATSRPPFASTKRGSIYSDLSLGHYFTNRRNIRGPPMFHF
jgi:hypothetical protein